MDTNRLAAFDYAVALIVFALLTVLMLRVGALASSLGYPHWWRASALKLPTLPDSSFWNQWTCQEGSMNRQAEADVRRRTKVLVVE